MVFGNNQNRGCIGQPNSLFFNESFPTFKTNDHQILLLQNIFSNLSLFQEIDMIRGILLYLSYQFLNSRIFYLSVCIQNGDLRPGIRDQLLSIIDQKSIFDIKNRDKN